MAVLNITYRGVSADAPVDIGYEMTDDDVRRIAVELVRSGGVPGFELDLPDDAFDAFVVDRFDTTEGGERLYLRPKVPFGAPV